MDAMIKKWYIRKKHAPPVVDIVIYDDMDALLRRSVKTIDDNEDEFDDVIEGIVRSLHVQRNLLSGRMIGICKWIERLTVCGFLNLYKNYTLRLVRLV